MDTLEYDTNPFGGVITNPAHLPDDAAEFEALLKSSLETWTSEGLKVVWLETPIEKAELIPIATRNGFTFHHSDEDYLMMTHRLEVDALGKFGVGVNVLFCGIVVLRWSPV